MSNTRPATADERWALGMYAVLARDACDFVDMLAEGTIEQVELLLRILEHPPSAKTDASLNEFGADLVRAHLEKRRR